MQLFRSYLLRGRCFKIRIRIYIRPGKWLEDPNKKTSISDWENDIDQYIENNDTSERLESKWLYLKNAPITHMPVLIHDSWDIDPNNHLLSPNLQLKESAAGSLTFTLHKKHPYWKNGITLMTDTVYVVRDDRIWWDGRPISYDQDIDGNISVTCEGALAYFNDTLMPSFSMSILESLYQFMHDHFIPEYHRGLEPLLDGIYDGAGCMYNDRFFYDASGQWFENAASYYWNPNYETHMEWLKSYILDNFQARCKIVYPENALHDYLLKGYPIPRFLIMFKDFTYNTVAERIPVKRIDFGENLTGFTLHREFNSAFMSSMLPRGQSIDDTTGRELPTFVYISDIPPERYLEKLFKNVFDSGRNTFFSNVENRNALKSALKAQLKYGVFAKYSDYSTAKDDAKLTKYASRDFKKSNIRSFSYASVQISGFDDGIVSTPAVTDIKASVHVSQTAADDPIDNSIISKHIFYNNGRMHKLYSDSTINNHDIPGIWPSRINYRVCDPRYFDIWTKVKATTSIFDDDDKQWNITEMDIDLENPFVPNLTLEKYSRKMIDSYIRYKAQIGNVASKFDPQ